MENKQTFPGFVGPSYNGRSKRFDCQRCVNMYLEVDEQLGAGTAGKGKNDQVAVLIGTPGLRKVQSVGAGPIRATYTVSNQNLTYVVSGNQVFQLAGANAVPVALVGNLTTETGAVSVADNGVQVIFVDGANGYYFTLGDDTLTLHQISDPHFYPADTVTFQDGYFILNQKGTTNFFISDLYSVTFLPLNVSAKTGNSDILVAVISLNRQLFLLGARTLEIWWDAGVSGSSPFQRQDGRFSQQGCAAPHSLAILQDTFYWLASNGQGGGVVMGMVNNVPTRISTHAVEYSIQNAGDLSGSTAYAYQEEGHYFYVLNVPGCNTTWVFDTATNLWHERQSSVNGAVGRHLGQTHALLNSEHLIGDYRSGNLYVYDLECYTDNQQMLPRIRQSPHFAKNSNNVFYHLLDVDFQFGVGLVDDGQNTGANVNPKVILEISRDGGKTFGLPVSASLGKIGRYNTRARFQGLGVSRDAVFRLTVTDAVELQLLSCMMAVTIGSS